MKEEGGGRRKRRKQRKTHVASASASATTKARARATMDIIRQGDKKRRTNPWRYAIPIAPSTRVSISPSGAVAPSLAPQNASTLVFARFSVS